MTLGVSLLGWILLAAMLGFAGAQSITVEHMYGSTTIPEMPERIVTVGLTDQDPVVALGSVPIATTDWGGTGTTLWPWALEKIGDAPAPEIALERSEIEYERILSLQPDLILSVSTPRSEEEYRLLSEIAPTVVGPASDNVTTPWQEQTRIIGEVLRKSDEADKLIAEVEASLEQVRQDHPDFVGATALVATDYSDLYVWGASGDPREYLLNSLGFKLPEELEVALGDLAGGNLSMERIDLLDTDVLIWLDSWPGEGVPADPLYMRLPVHTAGRDIFMGSSYKPLARATSFVTVLSIPYLLDELVPRLSAAIDGDPATAVTPPAPEPPSPVPD